MSTGNINPAFPLADSCTDYIGSNRAHANGMTMRDYFAAKTMQGMLAAGEGVPNEKLAKWAYGVADAMLAERAQGVES